MIQEGAHNPTIDARVSLQLVLLKLRQSLDFGDVIINGCTNLSQQDQMSSSIEQMFLDESNIKDMSTITKIIYETGLNIDQNFFQVLLDNSVSSRKLSILIIFR